MTTELGPNEKILTVRSTEVNDAAAELRNLLHLHEIHSTPAMLIAMIVVAVSNWPMVGIRSGNLLEVIQKIIENRVANGDPE